MVDAVGGGRERLRLGGFATLADAERACADVLGLGSPRAQARTWTVGRYLRYWLSLMEDRLRPTTLRNYRSIVRRHLIPLLGGQRLSKLTTKLVRRALDQVARTTVRGGRLISPASVVRVRATLRSAFNAAMQQGLMGHNPAHRVDLADGTRPRAVLWTAEREQVYGLTGIRPGVAVWEIRHVVEFLNAVLDDPLFAMWWIIAVRGPRRGEIAGLRWQDIDFVTGEFTIREQVVVVDGIEHLGPPKSAAGVRTIAFDPWTRMLLWRLCLQPGAGTTPHNPHGRVFVRSDGSPVTPDWLTRRFRVIADRLGLPPVRLHDMRHFAASLMHAAGADLKEIQESLGHSTVVTTADTYITLFKQTLRRVANETASLVLAHARFRYTLDGAAAQA